MEDLVLFRTDIGRHNAVDKIYGECFLNNIFLEDKVLVTTGRITSEILIKTGRMGIPILISRSAATSLAISLAEQIGVTLIGYVRGKNLIVYTGRERDYMTLYLDNAASSHPKPERSIWPPMMP